jgi:uncharacterized protein (DUF362 family)
MLPASTPRLGRRAFVKGVSAAVACLLGRPPGARASRAYPRRNGLSLVSASGTYQVGVGRSTNPYTATLDAVSSCDEWPAAAIAGRTVLIKPNLVWGLPAASGITTHPQVVRALVDLVLAADAREVLIIEGGEGGSPPFSACGYGFFNAYGPRARVRLFNLGSDPLALVTVPNGLAYKWLYVPRIAHEDGIVLISAAKLKCHVNSGVSLSLKNLVALAAPVFYAAPLRLPRWDLHARGIDESIVDLNLACPVDFAVIDGIWGMQGNGPFFGTPVRTDLVLAGGNALAVDLAAVQAMGISQASAPHLAYAASVGLGPADVSEINIVGDPFTPRAFLPAQTPPIVWRPVATPPSFSPLQGEETTISYSLASRCWTRVEIIRDNDLHPSVSVVRLLQDWTRLPAGTESLQWDGRGHYGNPVKSGTYLARVKARFGAYGDVSFATGRVAVV